MRITCPNCASHFEIPTELLGKKGRALKCASCGHSWYQSAQVDNLDLAAIMGEKYAQKAQAAAGGAPIRNAAAAQPQVGANRAAANRNAPAGAQTRVQAAPLGGAAPGNQNRVQAAPLGGPRAPGPQPVAAPIGGGAAGAPGAPPVPQGAVSMMSRNQNARANQPGAQQS